MLMWRLYLNIYKMPEIQAYKTGSKNDTLFEVTTTQDGDKFNLDIMDNQFPLQVSKGNVSNTSFIHKFGRNVDVDTAAAEDIWDGGGIYPFPAVGSKVTIVSSSTADTIDGGVGARTLAISGLDNDWTPANETINLSGTTAVIPANTYMRIYRMNILTAGASGINIGSVVAIHAGNNIAQISVEEGQTLMAVYTVPSGTTGYLYQWYATVEKKTAITANASLFVKESGGTALNLKSIAGITKDNNWQYNYPFPIKLASTSDIKVQAAVSANDGDIAGGFDILLIPE